MFKIIISFHPRVSVSVPFVILLSSHMFVMWKIQIKKNNYLNYKLDK